VALKWSAALDIRLYPVDSMNYMQLLDLNDFQTEVQIPLYPGAVQRKHQRYGVIAPSARFAQTQ
jgi:hypothetical protein